ncbi:retrotransposon protein, putative, ty1-copia subclass [Tanacetum coccineum]
MIAYISFRYDPMQDPYGFLHVGEGMLFFSQKRGGGGRGVKEKQQGSANDTTKDTVVVSSTVDDLDSRNRIGTQEGNVGKTPIDSNADPYIGNVPINITDSPTIDLPTSYAKLVTREPSRKSVNFRTLLAPAGSGADVAISLESVRAISERFANTIYGFFLGKRVAYPVVDNYVRNSWSKFSLVKSMLNSSNGLFFFKFSSKDGMDAMLDNGPWFIRNDPFILKKWIPDVNLLKEDVGSVLVWVKFHGVPMITSSYARVMVELRADEELKYIIVVAMPKLVGEGFYLCTIRVEYEWKPSRCSSCKVFGHVLDECPKNIVSDVGKNLKNTRKAAKGVQVGSKVAFKPIKQVYRHVSNRNNASTSGKKKQAVVSSREVSNSNSFDVNNSVENDDHLGTNRGHSKSAGKEPNSGVFPSDHIFFNLAVLDDNYDPYDDDLYESHDMSENLQAICDDFDIAVRDRKKK